jgi:glutaredoxin
MPASPKVTLYTRKGCCLCDDAKRVIESARKRSDFDLREVDIDADAALQSAYGDEVPVITINGSKAFKYRLSERELLKKLAARA